MSRWEARAAFGTRGAAASLEGLERAQEAIALTVCELCEGASRGSALTPVVLDHLRSSGASSVLTRPHTWCTPTPCTFHAAHCSSCAPCVAQVEYVQFTVRPDCVDPKTRRVADSHAPCTPHPSTDLLQRTRR